MTMKLNYYLLKNKEIKLNVINSSKWINNGEKYNLENLNTTKTNDIIVLKSVGAQLEDYVLDQIPDKNE